MIYVCKVCHFLFESAETAEQCPDCGKHSIRSADQQEMQEFSNRRLEDELSIRNNKKVE